MQVQIEEQGPVRKRVVVTVPAQRVERQFHTAYNQLSQKVSLPGFRRGKVPRTVLQKRYGARVAADVASELIDEGWRRAVSDHGLLPVGQPQIDAGPVHPGHDYSFSFTVEVPPDIELGDYEGIPVTMTEWSVPDDRVEHELEHLAERVATWEPVADRDEARAGDVAVIDFQGTTADGPIEGGQAEDFELELGSGRFLPGFEDQVIGHKVGEAFTVEVTFPEDYPASALAGKPAVFQVTLKQIKAKVVPTVGPDLAEKLGEENLDKVRERVRESMLGHWKQVAEREAHDAIRDHLAKQYDFELPPSLVEGALEDRRNTLLAEYVQGGDDLDTAREKATAEAEKARAEIEDGLRVQLVLDAIGEKEGIEVEERELAQVIDSMARVMGAAGQRVRQVYRDPGRRASLRARVRQDKVLEFLLTKANVTPVPKDVPAHEHGDAEATEEATSE